MSKPTARKLLDGFSEDMGFERYDDQKALVSRVEKVLDLHYSTGKDDPDGEVCVECAGDWPCPTIRILNGESE